MEAASKTLTEFIRPQAAGYPGLKSWLERLLFGFLLLLFVIRGLLPAWGHLDSDFTNYYLAAHVYREGYPVERVYEWTWFQRQKDHLGLDRPLVGFAPSTLTSALLIVPLSSMRPLTANRWWLAANLAVFVLTGALFKRMTSLPWRRIGALMFLAIAPLHNNFLLGQVHLVVLLLLAIAAYFYFDDRQFLCGVALAAAAALKIYPALFLLFFVVKRQWRAAAGLLCGLLAAALLSEGLFGLASCHTYLEEILPWGLRGEIINPYTTGWDSLNALLHRLFLFEPELNPAPVAHLPYLYAFLHWFIYALILVTFLSEIAARDASPFRERLEWASYCFLLLLLSSEPLPYHFVALILSAVLVVDCMIKRHKTTWAAAIVVVYALVCLPYNRIYAANPTGWKSLLFFPRLSWMLLLAGMLLWLLVSESRQTLRQRVISRSLAPAVMAFITIFVIGFVLETRHLAGQFENYRTRVATTLGSAIAIDPVVTDAGVFYGGLLPRFATKRDAYSLYRMQAGSVTSFGREGDWFHPAATSDGSRSWAETASKGLSRIVETSGKSGNSADAAVVTEAEDAEAPVVSADGRWLAFIREIRGRGSLWIRPLAGSPEQDPDSEREVAGPQYDVRDVSFSPGGRVFFSSREKSRYELFSVDFRSGIVTALASVNCSARYPALSSDGQWIAYSCERRGVWQLTIMNFLTGEERQVTTADCNSITPQWTRDSQSLIYATDCGRALGITALSKIDVVR